MNVTVAEPAGRSYRSPVHFFRVWISFWLHTSSCTRIC